MAHSEGLGWILSHAVLLFLTYLKAESVGPFWPCGFLRNDLSNRGKRLLAFQHACEKCCMARAPALGERPCPGGCTQATEAPRRQPRGATYSPEVSPGLTLWSHCISHGFSGGIFCPRLSMCSVFMLSRGTYVATYHLVFTRLPSGRDRKTCLFGSYKCPQSLWPPS